MNLITIPVDVLLGWGTNVIAIKMLTRPYLPKGIGPFKIHGLIPSRKEAFANGIADIISDKLLTLEDLSCIIDSTKSFDEIKNQIADNILEQISIPKASGIAAKKTVLDLLDQVLKDITWEPKSPTDYSSKIHKIIKHKICMMDIKDVDALINSVANSEFKFIERIGALVGLVIGLFQVFFF